MTIQLAQGFFAHFNLLPRTVLPGHNLPLTPALAFS